MQLKPTVLLMRHKTTGDLMYRAAVEDSLGTRIWKDDQVFKTPDVAQLRAEHALAEQLMGFHFDALFPKV